MPSQHYTDLRCLATDGSIQTLKKEAAGTLAALEACGLAEIEEPSSEGDRLLLDLAQTEHWGAFLSLRCRSTWPLEQAVRAMYRKCPRGFGLELSELAGFALDDIGRRYPYRVVGNERISGRVPLAVQVVRSWEPASSSLPYWARRQFEYRNDLKAYLRQQGIRSLGPWALLADASSVQVQDAMEMCASRSQLSPEAAQVLHRTYLPLYRTAKLVHRSTTGRQRGWLPDDHFLQQLDPEQPARRTRERLEFMAAAVNYLKSGQWQWELQQLLGEDGPDPLESIPAASRALDAEQPEASQLESKALKALQQAGEAYFKAMLQAIPGQEREQQLCFWAVWLAGASTRQIAEHCQAPQARVSRRLQVERRAGEIAQEALERLRGDPDFREVFESTERLDGAADRVANQLLRPEQEGGESPLRQMLRAAMNNATITGSAP